MKSTASSKSFLDLNHFPLSFTYISQVPSIAWAYPLAELCLFQGMKPKSLVLGGFAGAIKLDSCFIIAIVTDTGIFQRSSVLLAALYQDRFSLKILQTSAEFFGGPEVAQAEIRNKDNNKNKIELKVKRGINNKNSCLYKNYRSKKKNKEIKQCKSN